MKTKKIKHRKPVRRECRVHLWITKAEKTRLVANAAAAKLSRTDWIVATAAKERT